jgi:hypothetical protein
MLIIFSKVNCIWKCLFFFFLLFPGASNNLECQNTAVLGHFCELRAQHTRLFKARTAPPVPTSMAAISVRAPSKCWNFQLFNIWTQCFHLATWNVHCCLACFLISSSTPTGFWKFLLQSWFSICQRRKKEWNHYFYSFFCIKWQIKGNCPYLLK